MTFHYLVLFLAILFDRFFGDPESLWRRLPHPVVWFGWLITYFDKTINSKKWSDKKRFWLGWGTIAILLAITCSGGIVIHSLCVKLGWGGLIIEALIASIFLAQKSLKLHVKAVSDAFILNGIVGARHAVSMIVGRDPEKLDETGVASSAIESLAENTSDGIVSPAFWFLLLGLPGLLTYKMLNTADSMIAHLNEKYRYFGYATAKLDDVANYIPARLTAFLLLTYVWFKSGKDVCALYWKIIKQDARYHRSPNAGWPETAFAAALNIRLSGPRSYHGEISQEPYLNEQGDKPSMDDIPRALHLFDCILNLMLMGIFLLVMISYFVTKL